MKVKELIAKIRFSHIMCLGVGVLIPIYCDVLIFHGFTSSTVSAIMDTVVASSALYAAFSVRNWLKDRVKNKGFEHAGNLLTKIHQSYITLFSFNETWERFRINYASIVIVNEQEKQNIKNDKTAAIYESKELNKILNEVLADIHALKSWDMKCLAENEYIEYIEAVDKLRVKIEKTIIETTESKVNLLSSATHIIMVSEIKDDFKSLAEMYVMLKIRFEDVFRYVKSGGANIIDVEKQGKK
ncbi:hypothetical protein ACEZEZ_15200 [Kluyvera ascorbata]|uniref:hypothetical protein n=1 Tax=Kluyvera ascorbata TaxID=51288 RepID=UPI0035CD2EA9